MNLKVSLVLLAIILLGRYGLFLGHTFLVDDDIRNLFTQISGNAHSMGWRPDLGLGISHFYSDPGSGHVWALWRWWHQLFTNQSDAYNIAIIILLWGISITHYLLLKKIFLDFNSPTLIILSSLIGFGSLQYEFFFAIWTTTITIATPLVALIVFDHLEKPSIRQYFLYSITLFFTLFLGSAMALIFILIFSGIFFLGYIFYHRNNLGEGELWKKINRFIFLQFFCGITVIFLGAWIFYSIFIESQIVDYLRDPLYSSLSFFISPNFAFIFSRFFQYFHAGLISPWNGALGLAQIPASGSWINVAPVFPLILIVLFSPKSRNFWQFFSKFMVIGSFIYIEIISWAPGILSSLVSVFKIYPPGKIHPLFQTFQIVLIGVFIKEFCADKKTWRFIGQRWLSIAAIFLSFFYAFLFLLAITSQLMPQVLVKILSNTSLWLPYFFNSPNAVYIIEKVAIENIYLFKEHLGFSYILFYGTTLGLMIFFSTRRWPELIKWKKGLPFVAFLLINNLFLSWSVYPMNKEKPIWDQQKLESTKTLKPFKPTDRVAFIASKPCRGSIDYFSCIDNKFINTSFGARRHFAGYFDGPSLNFSAGKRFTQKPQSLYLKALLLKENIHYLNNGLRDLFPGEQSSPLTSLPSFYDSKLFDLTSVNYFLSADPMPKSDHLEPVHASKQFFLYRNLDAWPYYYLANRIKTFQNLSDLYYAQQGTAFLKESQVFFDPIPSQRHLELLEFKYGDLKFKYHSDGNEFLVVQDTWHPSWRAFVNGKETKIFNTNGTFKGILLPSGEGEVHLYFDYSKYTPGIAISLVAWAIFIFGWKQQNKKLSGSSTLNFFSI